MDIFSAIVGDMEDHLKMMKRMGLCVCKNICTGVKQNRWRESTGGQRFQDQRKGDKTVSVCGSSVDV